MQNRAQMKESECAKDILKCANEKRRNHNINKSFFFLDTASALFHLNARAYVRTCVRVCVNLFDSINLKSFCL